MKHVRLDGNVCLVGVKGNGKDGKSVIISGQIKMKCYMLFQEIIRGIHMISVNPGFV